MKLNIIIAKGGACIKKTTGDLKVSLVVHQVRLEIEEEAFLRPTENKDKRTVSVL